MRKYKTVSDIIDDLDGKPSGERCPRCGEQVLVNALKDVWCSSVSCGYGETVDLDAEMAGESEDD